MAREYEPGDDWIDDGDDEARLDSAAALVRFALTDPSVHHDHVNRLINEAIWFYSERGKVSRKYDLRFRSLDALTIQRANSKSQAAKFLAHEHVFPRKELVVALNASGADVRAILKGADACVVTREEHQSLNAHGAQIGWERYRAAGIVVVDLAEREIVLLSDGVAEADG